jgi:hypothetical protein
MKLSRPDLLSIVRETLKKKNAYTLEEVESTGDVDVDRVVLYLDAITEREEMLLAIPLMFKKIMAYEDHNVTVGEFHDLLKQTFDDTDANILFTLLSRASLEAVEDENGDGEKKQDAKDREDERLADEDKEASDREDAGDKYAQSLADRRRESAGAKKKLRGEGVTNDLNEALIQKALRRALRRD